MITYHTHPNGFTSHLNHIFSRVVNDPCNIHPIQMMMEYQNAHIHPNSYETEKALGINMKKICTRSKQQICLLLLHSSALY